MATDGIKMEQKLSKAEFKSSQNSFRLCYCAKYSSVVTADVTY